LEKKELPKNIQKGYLSKSTENYESFLDGTIILKR